MNSSSSSSDISNIISKVTEFFSTFGNLEGMLMIITLAGVYLGYKYLNNKIRLAETEKENQYKEAQKSIEQLNKKIADTKLEYELKLKDILNDSKIESIKEASKLRSHPFFQSCEYWITRVELFPIRDKFRHTVFVDYVRIFLRTGKQVWEELIEELIPGVEELSTMELYSKVVKLLHRKNTLTEHECKELHIPDVFIDKVAEDWNGPTEKLLYVCISSICNSDRFESNANRLAVILNLNTALYEVMVFEAESLVEELNGELEGAEYKGMICCDKKI